MNMNHANHSMAPVRDLRQASWALSFIAMLALAGCGKSEAPASVAAPAAPPLQALDAVAEDKTATLIENKDGSTRVVTGEAAAEPDRKDGETPPKTPE